jgi:hypothetical protein
MYTHTHDRALTLLISFYSFHSFYVTHFSDDRRFYGHDDAAVAAAAAKAGRALADACALAKVSLTRSVRSFI